MEIDDDLVYLEVAGKAPFELHVVWIIRILKYNLKGKSEFYKEVHTCHDYLIYSRIFQNQYCRVVSIHLHEYVSLQP